MLLDYAKTELDKIGMTEDNEDEYNIAIRNHILKMIEVFSEEGHSGFSASYTIDCLSKLLKYEPLSPLTGEDDEWHFINVGPEMMYQNNRCYRVFKRADGTAYDSRGKVFLDKDGYCFANINSQVDITFPYTPNTEYLKEEQNA